MPVVIGEPFENAVDAREQKRATARLRSVVDAWKESPNVRSAMPNAKNRVQENAYLTSAYRASAFTDQPFNDPVMIDAAERLEHDAIGRGLEADGG